jgi:hypothetical protein
VKTAARLLLALRAAHIVIQLVVNVGQAFTPARRRNLQG